MLRGHRDKERNSTGSVWMCDVALKAQFLFKCHLNSAAALLLSFEKSSNSETLCLNFVQELQITKS